MIVKAESLHTKGILLLILTTILWGTSFPLLKNVLGSLSPSVIVTVRFGLAAVVFSPWLRRLNARLVRDGFLLGCIYFAGNVSCLLGLESISANRSAFIVSFNVILVPLFVGILGQRLKAKMWLAAILALVGIAVMSWEGGGLSAGEWWTLGCALAITCYIICLQAITSRHLTLPLVAVQLTTMTVLSVVWSLPELISQIGDIGSQFHVLLYLGLGVTAIPIWSQAVAQQWVPAYETALIYTLEPVFACVFSFVILGEKLGIRGLVGAVLILIATLLSQKQVPRRT